jgi:hypothetical protein
LYGIAAHRLADSRRRGRVEDDARHRLALEPLAIDDEELARLEELADPGAAVALSEGTPVSASSTSASATVRSQPSPRPKGSGG